MRYTWIPVLAVVWLGGCKAGEKDGPICASAECTPGDHEILWRDGSCGCCGEGRDCDEDGCWGPIHCDCINDCPCYPGGTMGPCPGSMLPEGCCEGVLECNDRGYPDSDCTCTLECPPDADSAPDAPDDVIDEAPDASDALDVTDVPDAPPDFPATECNPEPAVAAIEVQLTTMQARGWVDSGPETMDALTDEVMLANLQDALLANGCVPEGHWLLTVGVEYTEMATEGSLSWLYIPSGDPMAGAVFDHRTGDMAFSMKGTWLTWEKRCTPPDPLTDLASEFSEAVPPHTCFRYCSSGGVDPVCHDCETEMHDLNYWGGVWALEAGETWTDRTYDEVLELVMCTSMANAFAVCGPYEMFVRGLTTPGGAHAGDLDDIRMVFVLAGHADQSVLP